MVSEHATPNGQDDARAQDDAGDLPVLGIRGLGNAGPRWQHVAEMFTELERTQARGGAVASEPVTRRIIEATQVPDVDATGLDIRARGLTNLAAIVEAKGDLEGSIALATEAIDLCHVVEADVGTARRTVDVRIGCLINRAQTLALVGRDADGLADLATAEAAFDADTPPLLAFGLHNTRGNAWLALERFEEAEAEFRAALDVALAHEPRLAAHASTGLAGVLHRTGDRAAAREQMRLARDLQATGAASAAHVDEGLARLALEQGDTAEAEALFSAAERGFLAGGDPRRAAGSRFGRAAVLLNRGRLLGARRIARQALDDFTEQGDIAARIETTILLGDIYARALRFVDADDHYLRARELCAAHGTMHELARIDVRRAGVAHHAAGVAIRPSEKQRRLLGALNLALPAALATDAMRQRFSPGPVRERWVTGVAGVALTITMEILVSLQHSRLVIELLEFVSAAATLDASGSAARSDGLAVHADARSPFETASPEGTPLDAEYALTAAGAPGDGTPGIAPGLPPRVRSMPDGSDEFHQWIEEAERRYELRIRSTDVIDAW